jgi:steroid 5-alpha reductase family enzyme
MNPLQAVVVVALIVCAIVWILSLITHEHSWVDRIWSIVPVVYVWIFAGFAGLSDARLDVMAVLVTIWGARLTFNFARKGGYSGEEDYRWAILRGRMPRAGFEVFNLLFIVGYQNLVLLAITLPALTAYEHRSTPFGAWDVVVAVVFFACTVGETVADQQQWRFHAWKKSELAAGRQPYPQFLQSGLFRVSRHPNFFFEQAQWWVLFFFGVVAAGSIAQWTVVGPVLLLTIFIGSTNFTESITKSKYPEYADYQTRTSPIVPWFPRRERASHATAQ